MSLRWKKEGFDQTATDASGRIIARVRPRMIGEAIRWTITPPGAKATGGLAATVRAAKVAAEEAYVRLST